MKNRMRSSLLTVLGIAIFIGIVAVRPNASKRAKARLSRPPIGRLPGEFEQQGALVLACQPFIHEFTDTFADIVRGVQGHVPLVVLVSGPEDSIAVRRILNERGIAASGIRFVQAPHQTMWIRDFGPLVLQKTDGTSLMVDSNYEWGNDADAARSGVGFRFQGQSRAAEDNVSHVLGKCFGIPVSQTVLTIDGGHFASNGQGLCLTSWGWLKANEHRGASIASLRDSLREIYGFRKVVVLDNPPNDPTGHVDIMATFTSANTVVVSSADPAIDAESAKILDGNAEMLSKIKTATGQLRVVRIPSPHFRSGLWGSYNNVVFANGVLLMPVYEGLDPEGRKQAYDTYSQLLPGWKIVEIDARPFLTDGGGPHCATLNLGRITLPQTASCCEEAAESTTAPSPPQTASNI